MSSNTTNQAQEELQQAQAELAAKLSMLDALAANFNQNQPMDSALKKLWLEILKPYSAEHVTRAVMQVINTYKYKTLPPFAVLQDALDDLDGTSEAVIDQMALAEWNLLQTTIRKIGSYRTPELHPTTAYALSTMGGWSGACGWMEADMPFRKKEFLEAWKNSHNRVYQMALGAAGVMEALPCVKIRNDGPKAMNASATLNRMLASATNNADRVQ